MKEGDIITFNIKIETIDNIKLYERINERYN